MDLIGGTRMAKGAGGAAGDMCAGGCGRGLVPVMRVPRRPRCGEEEDGEAAGVSRPVTARGPCWSFTELSRTWDQSGEACATELPRIVCFWFLRSSPKWTVLRGTG